MAIKLGNVDIFNLLLQNKSININIEDELGNTPLMEAYLFKNKTFIESLFRFKNLDYLHRNKKGEDALSLANAKNQKPKNRSEYQKVLLGIKLFANNKNAKDTKVESNDANQENKNTSSST